MWLPELGMYYYKARIYSPTLGRFLQTDPIGYEDQYNLYAYVGNDPINGVDPSGMYECSGSDADCAAFEEYHANLEKVASQTETRTGSKLRTSTRAARGAQNALNQIGDPGVANGVTLTSNNNLTSDGEASEDTWFGFRQGTYTIQLNRSKVQANAARDGVSESVAGAVLLGHEGIHVYQLKRGHSNYIAREVQAYAIDYNIGLALGYDQNPKGLARRVYLRSRAEASCTGNAAPGSQKDIRCTHQAYTYLP